MVAQIGLRERGMEEPDDVLIEALGWSVPCNDAVELADGCGKIRWVGAAHGGTNDGPDGAWQAERGHRGHVRHDVAYSGVVYGLTALCDPSPQDALRLLGFG